MRIVSGMLTCILLGAVTVPALAQRGKKLNDLAAPAGLAFSLTPSALTITWPVVTGALRYDALRRNGTAQEQLGSSPTNAFVLPVPAKGVTYEYQITAVGRTASAASAWVPYTVPAETTVTALLVQPVTSATGMVTYAGPARTTATSPVPGQIYLYWNPVTNATRYKVLRSNSGGEVDRELPCGGAPDSPDWIRYIDGPVDFRWTFSYKVYAYVMSSGNEVLTAPSPTASAKSIPFVQVSGLTYTSVPSVKSPGRMDVTIKWNAVNGAEKYIVFDETWAAPKEMSVTSYVQPSMPLGYTLRVCVGAIYPYNVRQDNTVPCIDIKT